MLDIKQFGKRIAFLRRQNGMSQEKRDRGIRAYETFVADSTL